MIWRSDELHPVVRDTIPCHFLPLCFLTYRFLAKRRFSVHRCHRVLVIAVAGVCPIFIRLTCGHIWVTYLMRIYLLYYFPCSGHVRMIGHFGFILAGDHWLGLPDQVLVEKTSFRLLYTLLLHFLNSLDVFLFIFPLTDPFTPAD